MEGKRGKRKEDDEWREREEREKRTMRGEKEKRDEDEWREKKGRDDVWREEEGKKGEKEERIGGGIWRHYITSEVIRRGWRGGQDAEAQGVRGSYEARGMGPSKVYGFVIVKK